jgi:hypothetical protein
VPSRTPSPEWPGGAANGSSTSSLDNLDGNERNGLGVRKLLDSDEAETRPKPSAKALGKRKLVETGQRDRKYTGDDSRHNLTLVTDCRTCGAS